MPAYTPDHFNPVSVTSGIMPSIQIRPSTTISAQLLGKTTMTKNTSEHIDSITQNLKQLRADGYKSRQAMELLINQNERNQLNLIHRLEIAVFDAMHDGVSEDDIAAIDPTVENILRDVEDSLVH